MLVDRSSGILHMLCIFLYHISACTVHVLPLSQLPGAFNLPLHRLGYSFAKGKMVRDGLSQCDGHGRSGGAGPAVRHDFPR